ncbi:MAG: flagellin lysine-N-methylase [Terracidiphilus sp.]
MPFTPIIRSVSAEDFRCIGSACEDTCCEGWSVPIDRHSFEKYQQLPPSPLHDLIDASILVMPAETNPASFAKIQMNGENRCPMLNADRLCRIQAEMSEAYLSHTCATYPRIVQSIGGVQETALSLSCPEAARLVLLNPNLLAKTALTVGMQSAEAAEDSGREDASGLHTCFHPWFQSIRQAVLDLVANRAYPLWQRLFLLGVLCRRLDSIGKGELNRSVPAFLADFEASVASGALRSAMQALPLDREAQLDVVLRLAGMLLRRSNVRPRFVECVQAFTTGIGNGPGATLKSLAIHYSQAHDRYYAPFFDQHPHILENYLVNTIMRCRFPFGKDEARISMAREYALLTAQFALTKGFLIGVAGFHREALSASHIVHTVQATSKHFEHHPEFLNLAYALLQESQMEGARGLAILLRNADTIPHKPAEVEINAPEPLNAPVAVTPN